MNGLVKRMSLLAIVMVVAIASLGAAYTLWYEDLELHADITTGELDGSWRVINRACTDNEPPEKDIGTVVYTNPFLPGPPIGQLQTWIADELTLVLTNGYPGYTVDCEIHVLNTGTVPWHVEVIEIMVELPNGDIITYECNVIDACAIPAGGPIGVQWLDGANGNGLGCQIHSDGEFAGSFFFWVNQPALEASSYKIWFRLQLNQWNESGWSGCGQQTGPAVLPPV